MSITWQDEAHTNRVRGQYGIAIGDEGEAIDASGLSLGDSITWTGSFSPLPVYLTDDDIDIEAVDEDGIEINPPTAPGIIAIIRDKVGIRRVNFTSQEVGAKLIEHATNAVEINATTGDAQPGTGVWAESQDFARKAMAIEIRGIGIVWMPSVEIKVLPPSTGVKKATTQEVVVDVFTKTVGTGDTARKVTHLFLEYQPGT